MDFYSDDKNKKEWSNVNVNRITCKSLDVTDGLPAPKINNIITVGKEGFSVDFRTINEALAVAQAGDNVVVYNGTYNENLVIPSGIRVSGQPDGNVVFINGSDTSTSRVIMTNGSTLRDVSVQTCSVGNRPAIDCTQLFAGQQAVLDGIRIRGNGNNLSDGVLADTDNVVIAVLSCFHNGGVIGNLINCLGGTTMIIQEIICNFGTCESIINVQGTNTLLELQRLATNFNLAYNCQDVFKIHSGKLSAINVLIPTNSPAQNGIHVVGNIFEFEMVGSLLHGIVNDIKVLSSLTGIGSIFNYIGLFQNEKTDIPGLFISNATTNVIQLDNGINDNSGIKILASNFDVGKKGQSCVTSMGQGGHTTVGMLIFSEDSVFVDNTESARSQSGSTFDLFQDVTSSNKAYFGNSNRTFLNMNNNVVSGIVLGAGALLWEYWNGSNWTSFTVMSSHDSTEYEQHAEDVYSRVQVDNIRFDKNILIDWAKTTVNSENAFWIRLSITSDITTSPSLQRILLSGNAFNVQGDGFKQTFGAGQQVRLLPISQRYALDNFTPTTATFNLSSNIILSLPNSRFNNNQIDAFGITTIIENGIDTSCPLQVKIRWAVLSTGSGDVELVLTSVSGFTIGDNVDNNSLTEISSNIITTIDSSNDDGYLHETVFSVPIQNELVDDQLTLAIIRDARNSNGLDTLSNAIQILEFEILGTHWN